MPRPLDFHISTTCHEDVSTSIEQEYWPAYYFEGTVHLDTVFFWQTVLLDNRVKYPERVFIKRFVKTIEHEVLHHAMNGETTREGQQHWAMKRIGVY